MPTFDLSVDIGSDKPDRVTSTNAAILVAEDNIISQALMRAQLEIIGYKAGYAVNGLEALNYWREGNYDIL